MIFEHPPSNLNDTWKMLMARGNEDYKAWLQDLWKKYKPYAPPGFKDQIEKSGEGLDDLTWEMVLASFLLDAGFSLVKANSFNQPDLCICYQGKKVWIECHIPQKGDPSKLSSVPEIKLDAKLQSIDMDKTTLRFTNSLSKKAAQYRRWLDNSICGKDEPFIIAFHGKKLDFQVHESAAPDISRALYGMKDQFIRYDDNRIPTEFGYHHAPSVPKQTQEGIEDISSKFFLEESNRIITGVIFSNYWYRYYFNGAPTTCYVKNILTTNPSDISFSAFAQEYEYQKRENGSIDLCIKP